MNRYIAPVIAIVVAAVVILISLSVYIVNQREQAIVTRSSAIVSTNSDPGLYFKVPTNFVDTVQVIDRRMLRIVLEDKVVQVREGYPVGVKSNLIGECFGNLLVQRGAIDQK